MKIAIIICDRYGTCNGCKCFRSVINREGAFARYADEEELTVVGYATCGGCPGGNVENVASGMKAHGAEVIHLATGVLAGYPPCRNLTTHIKFIEESTGLPVVVGTHPMPSNYIELHEKVGDWTDKHMEMMQDSGLLEPGECKKYDSSLAGYSVELQKEL